MCNNKFGAINSLIFLYFVVVVPDIAAWKKMKLCECVCLCLCVSVRACVWHFSYKNAGKLFDQIVHCVWVISAKSGTLCPRNSSVSYRKRESTPRQCSTVSDSCWRSARRLVPNLAINFKKLFQKSFSHFARRQNVVAKIATTIKAESWVNFLIFSSVTRGGRVTGVVHFDCDLFFANTALEIYFSSMYIYHIFYWLY